MDHGKLVEWLVKPGDYVRRGDLVAVVDTAKTIMDVESFQEGVVGDLLVDVGATVPVGTPLARIVQTPAETGPPDHKPSAAKPARPKGPVRGRAVTVPAVEAPPKVVTQYEGARESSPQPHAVPISPPIRHLAHQLGVDTARIQGTGKNGAITRGDVEHASSGRPDNWTRSSPRARSLAAELGRQLAGIAGTGPQGAVTERDVLRSVASQARPGGASPGAAAAPVPKGVHEEPSAAKNSAAGERVASLRHAIGTLMSRSKKTIPHYYLSTTVDLRAAVDWMQSVNAQRPVAARLVPSALLLKAAALAALETPEVNGFFIDGKFRPSGPVHLGVAVALRQGGIVAPAIHNAETLTVEALMEQLRDLVSRARAGRLQRAEMADPTLTVTNLGDLGVDSVYGVIYPPQVAMLGFGRVLEQPWAHNGLLGVRPAVIATLSADHRVSDGLRGGRYLARIDELLQHPEEL